MKKAKSNFDALINLLELAKPSDRLIMECLSQKKEELAVSFFSDDGHKTTRKHLFDIYKTRSIVLAQDKDKVPYVIGYDKLLPKLDTSDMSYVNISSVTTQKGTYIIFSDYEYTKYIGILKSMQTLSEIREIMKDSKYYKEITFYNGELIGNK